MNQRVSQNMSGVLASNALQPFPSTSQVVSQQLGNFLQSLPPIPQIPNLWPTTVASFVSTAAGQTQTTVASTALPMRPQHVITVTHTVQSNPRPIASNVTTTPFSCQPSGSVVLSQGQTAADQKLQISMMSFKVPLPQFCPLTHDSRAWVDTFEYYCNEASKTYNLPLEKVMWDNLYSLFPKDEKSWLMGKTFSGRPFSWELLKEQLLDHFSRLCNRKFKEIYMREWDGVQSYIDFGKEKLKLLKIIFPDLPLKKIVDIVRSGLPDDVNIDIGKGHMMYDSEEYFLDVLIHQDIEREKANFELQNEIANQTNQLNSTQNGQANANQVSGISPFSNDVLQHQVLQPQTINSATNTAPTQSISTPLTHVPSTITISPLTFASTVTSITTSTFTANQPTITTTPLIINNQPAITTTVSRL